MWFFFHSIDTVDLRPSSLGDLHVNFSRVMEIFVDFKQFFEGRKILSVGVGLINSILNFFMSKFYENGEVKIRA